MTPKTKECYDMAVIDLRVAKHLEETYRPKPLEIICYLCQQAAEKAIKALIYIWAVREACQNCMISHFC